MKTIPRYLKRLFSDPGPGSRRSWPLQSLMLAIPVLLFGLLGWHKRWIVDDGYIYLRVVDMVTSGHGPVFNIGERIEAFTGPLWLGILVLADLTLPIRLEWLSVGIGLALATAGMALSIAGAATLVRLYAPRAWLMPFGALVPLGLVVAWIFATSGLETGLVVAWLGGCLFVLARWAASDQRLPLYGAVIIGLGWLVRPELALHSALFVGAVVLMQWPRESWGQRLQTLLAATALPIGYQIFRMGYYGAVIANSAIAKDATRTHWDVGWFYLVDFATPYWLWLALIIVIVGGYIPLSLGLLRASANRGLVITGLFIVAGIFHGLYIVAGGGDWLHGRLLLPAVYALVAPVAVIPLTRPHILGLLIIPWFLISSLSLRPSQLDPEQERVTPYPVYLGWSNAVLIEQRGWSRDRWQRRSWYQGEGFYYDRRFAKDFAYIDLEPSDRIRLPAAAIGGVGASGYAMGPEWQIIDLWGLAHHISARMISTPSYYNRPRLAGHEKPFPNVWLAALITAEGTILDSDPFPQRGNPLIPHSLGEEFQRQVERARTVLQCPPLQELHAAVTEPLSLARFRANFTGAWARTRLAIPPDTRHAWLKFCV